MLITNQIGVPRGAKMNGLGVWWMAIAEILGSQQAKPGTIGVQPAIVQNAPAAGSDTGLYLGLGVGLLAVTGLAVTLLRSPARKPVAGYRRRSRRSRR